MLDKFQNIKHFIFDIDGVLTNGSLLIAADGSLLRTMNIRDGYALQLAIRKGYSVSIISGAKGDALEKRLLGLGVEDVYLGISDKLEILNGLVQKGQIDLNHTLYMGDDMPDLKVMLQVAMPCCPSNACPEVKKVSLYISPASGGQGCVRDVIEKVLKLNHDWE
ncbi:MAG: HAD hydrolase family protein [Chitinophagaceae bacterium]|nr:HAD hydrolase family protein [Chitinophagaceae bacterium]